MENAIAIIMDTGREIIAIEMLTFCDTARTSNKNPMVNSIVDNNNPEYCDIRDFLKSL